MKIPALLSVALLLLLFSGTFTESSRSHGGRGNSCGSRGHTGTGSDQTPITILVSNKITNSPDRIYATCVVFRGILIGAMRRLQNSSEGFTFTYTEDPNYGPFLKSVNGLHGSTENRTYWELLVKKPDNNVIIRPDVGIGCYIPSANDQVILNYNTY